MIEDFYKKTISTKQYKNIEVVKDVKYQAFCVPNLLKFGQIALLAGSGGCGKSFLCLRLLHDLSRGFNSFTGDKIHARKCLFLTAEDDDSSVLERLQLIEESGAQDAEAIEDSFILSLINIKDSFLLKNGQKTSFFEDLKDYIVKEGIELLMIDPIANIGGLQDENSNTEVYILINALNELINARDCNLAILITHHLGKESTSKYQQQASLVNRVRGASALVNGTRLVIAMVYEDGASSFEIVKSNSLNPTQRRNIQKSQFGIDSEKARIVTDGKEISLSKRKK